MVVGRTGRMLNVPTPVAVHAVPAGMPLHGWAGSRIETVTVPGTAKSSALRRRRAPVEQGVVEEQVGEVVVVVEVEAVGTGNRTLICPEVESFGTGCVLNLIFEAEERFGASR